MHVEKLIDLLKKVIYSKRELNSFSGNNCACLCSVSNPIFLSKKIGLCKKNNSTWSHSNGFNGRNPYTNDGDNLKLHVGMSCAQNQCAILLASTACNWRVESHT